MLVRHLNPRARVFPEAQGSPAPPQRLVTGLPPFPGPQGVSYYGADNTLIASLRQRSIFVVQASTAAVVGTISKPGSEFFGSGTVAVAPDQSAALTSGNSNTSAPSSQLNVIRAPFNASSTINQVTVPGSIYTATTQAIVFNAAAPATLMAFSNTKTTLRMRMELLIRSLIRSVSFSIN